MFCPSCGQEQIAEDTRFCSRCGLLLTNITEIMHNAGVLPQMPADGKLKTKFLRKKGTRQGIFIFLLSFIIVPIIAVLTIAAHAEPFGAAIAAVLFGGGGLLRIAYAMLFESDQPGGMISEEENMRYFGAAKSVKNLPPQQSIPVSGYVPPKQGTWRDTNDLGQPTVTEGTTQLLHDE